MQKTKLGISVGVLCAILFFVGFFGGWIPTLLIAGYILLNEENPWLKKTTIKAVMLMLLFAIVPAILNLIPGLFDIITSTVLIFKDYLKGEFFGILSDIERVISTINTIIYYAEKIIFLLLGFLALKQSTIKLPLIDDLLNKYID